MKPFVLADALAGKAVVTRSGLKVTQVTKFIYEDGTFDIMAVVEDHHAPTFFNNNGSFFPNSPSNIDLFMASEKRTIWLNVAPNGYASVYPSKEEAERCTGPLSYATGIPVEVEI